MAVMTVIEAIRSTLSRWAASTRVGTSITSDPRADHPSFWVSVSRSARPAAVLAFMR